MKKLINMPSCLLGILLMLFQIIISTGIIEAKQSKQVASSPASKAESTESQVEGLKSLGLTDQELSSIMLTGIPVADNALGDMNQDSVVNVWDLLRIRNIALGIGSPASEYELAEGDLTLDGAIDAQDVLFVKDVLFQVTGPPFLLDPTGGEITGAGVTFTFDSGAVESSAVLWVEDVTEEAIKDSTGVDFAAMASDSVYFMKAFKLAGDTGALLQPATIEIGLNELPPCSLQGSNYVFNASVGPFGEPQLVAGGELIVVDSGSARANYYILVFPPPPQPTFTPVQTSAIPGGFLEYKSKNISKVVRGNVFRVDTPDGRTVLDNPSFCRFDSNGISLKLRVPRSSPGYGTIYFGFAADSPSFNTYVGEFEVLALPDLPATLNSDSILVNYLLTLDTLFTKLDIFADTVSTFSDSSAIDVYKYVSDQLVTIHPMLDLIIDSLYNVNSAFRDSIGNIIYQNDYIFYLDSAIQALDDSIVRYSIQEFDGFWDGWDDVADALDTGGGIIEDFGDYMPPYPMPIPIPIPPYVICCVPAGPAVSAAGKMTKLAGWSMRYYREVLDWADGVDPWDWFPDPKKPAYEGICTNVWRHGANCDGTLRSSRSSDMFATSKSLVTTSLGGQYDGLLLFGSRDERILDYSLPVHELSGAIVTASVGSHPPGITGIVNEYGYFTLAGAYPGAVVTYSIYDPKTGLYDADFATVTAPNVAEQGIYFPVMGFFNPDTTQCSFPIVDGLPESDSVSGNCPRLVYQYAAGQDDIGKEINVNFTADQPLTFWLQEPSGAFVIQNTSTTCENVYQFTVNDKGKYLITVTYGSLGEEGPFVVGVNEFPYPATQYLCGTILYDTLLAGFFPYQITQGANLSGGDTVAAESGVVIEFDVGGVLTGDGVLKAAGTLSQGVTLRPATGGKRIDLPPISYRPNDKLVAPEREVKK